MARRWPCHAMSRIQPCTSASSPVWMARSLLYMFCSTSDLTQALIFGYFMILLFRLFNKQRWVGMNIFRSGRTVVLTLVFLLSVAFSTPSNLLICEISRLVMFAKSYSFIPLDRVELFLLANNKKVDSTTMGPSAPSDYVPKPESNEISPKHPKTLSPTILY